MVPTADLLPDTAMMTPRTVEPSGLATVEPGPARVLVVDDDPAGAEGLARGLGRLGYAVTTAGAGRAALERAAAAQPDVVLLDISLPDMSGMEVLRVLRADPVTADAPVILVSGLDRTEIIVEGLRLGANDYMTKPVNLAILEAKIATRVALKRTRDDLKRTIRRQAAEIDHSARELDAAGRVQRSILPHGPVAPAGLTTAWCYEPATAVGGDLFDVIPLPGGRTLLFVADAMGHGMQAALVASTVKATLAAHLAEVDELPILMGLLDLALSDLFADRFVTAALCVVDPAARTMRHVVAGHPPILVSGTEGVRALRATDPPLGMNLGLVFREGEEIALDPGAAILLYTDGLTEAEDAEGHPFGGDALARAFARLAPSGPEAIVGGLREAVEAFRGPRPMSDDLTILAARLT